MDRPLDFNELLVENPTATFAVRAVDNSMIRDETFPRISVIDSILLTLLDEES